MHATLVHRLVAAVLLTVLGLGIGVARSASALQPQTVENLAGG